MTMFLLSGKKLFYFEGGFQRGHVKNSRIKIKSMTVLKKNSERKQSKFLFFYLKLRSPGFYY